MRIRKNVCFLLSFFYFKGTVSYEIKTLRAIAQLLSKKEVFNKKFGGMFYGSNQRKLKAIIAGIT